MLILVLVFTLVRTLLGAPTTDTSNLDLNELNSSFLYRRSLTFGLRGTSDIVLSCLATIFACTWTAIHPNIPGPTDCGWTILKRRVIMVVGALLAPEVVVWWAMRQRIVAKRITDSYNKEIATVAATPDTRSFCQRALGFIHQWFNDGPLPRPQEESEVRRWTVTHGFFVLMGGFMLSEKGVPIQVLPYFKEAAFHIGGKQTKGHEGLERFMKQKVIYPPTTTEADIKDRSKGDTISKTVVILQTIWFVLQCFMRWSHGLTVTELEVVTLGFALLNGITYGLWWEKPQGVGVPVYLERRVMKEVGVGESIDVVKEEPEASEALEDDSESTGHDEADMAPLPTSNTPASSKGSFLPKKLRKDRGNHPSFIFWTLNVPIRLIQALLHPLAEMMDDVVIAEGALRVPMSYSAVAKESEDSIIMYTSFLIAMLFGSVHLIPAWFLPFPSSTEMWLWRVSAVVITTEPALLPLAAILDEYDHSVLNVVKVIIVILVFLGSSLYIFSRVILITLSFTTLRALPSDAYHTIDWVSAIPHF